MLRPEVNLVEANKVHLRISSQMLALARRVVSKTEAAKSQHPLFAIRELSLRQRLLLLTAVMAPFDANHYKQE